MTSMLSTGINNRIVNKYGKFLYFNNNANTNLNFLVKFYRFFSVKSHAK